MTTADIEYERKRLLELYSCQILDTEAEREFDDLAELATVIAGTPMSAISLIDLDRQWLKARIGLGYGETPRGISFCSHAIEQDAPFIVTDATKDERFILNPNVTGDPFVRFYAGFPLTTANGYKLGTLCVIDRRPRELSPQQMEILNKLSAQVMKLIELRVKNDALTELKEKVESQRDQLSNFLDHQKKLMAILAHDTRGPLGSMQKLLHLYTSKKISNDPADLFALIDRELEKILLLINNITSWGSAYLSTKASEERAVELYELTEEAVGPLCEMAAGKNVALINKGEGTAQITNTKDVLCFIIRNLVHNAIKFTENGKVEITASSAEENLLIKIADTGVGMPGEIKNNLFRQKSYSRTGTRNEHGSGLGLMLIHDFIQKTGGQISVTSETNTGTTFSVCLPLENL